MGAAQCQAPAAGYRWPAGGNRQNPSHDTGDTQHRRHRRSGCSHSQSLRAQISSSSNRGAIQTLEPAGSDDTDPRVLAHYFAAHQGRNAAHSSRRGRLFGLFWPLTLAPAHARTTAVLVAELDAGNPPPIQPNPSRRPSVTPQSRATARQFNAELIALKLLVRPRLASWNVGTALSSEAEGADRLARGNGHADAAPSPCSVPFCHAYSSNLNLFQANLTSFRFFVSFCKNCVRATHPRNVPTWTGKWRIAWCHLHRTPQLFAAKSIIFSPTAVLQRFSFFTCSKEHIISSKPMPSLNSNVRSVG